MKKTIIVGLVYVIGIFLIHSIVLSISKHTDMSEYARGLITGCLILGLYQLLFE